MAYTFKHGDRPLDGYTIQRAVGRGGFGEVYYAISDGGREVALKYLRDNPQIELRGVSNCINLKSPHLVSIFDVRKAEDGNYVIIMEYCSGPSLRDLLIAEPNGFGAQKAAFFAREIAKGLAYLHDRGIVHRDLKPGNIFYDDGYVKIGDYGLSKFISISRHSAQTVSVGTVHYMAPEIGSGDYSRGVDIYALGVILYEMLMGKVPFEGSSMAEILMKHLTTQPEVDQLPHPFGQVIRKALEKDPKDRYQTTEEMMSELLEVDAVRESLAGFSPQSLEGAVRGGETLTFHSPVPSPNPSPGAARGTPIPIGSVPLPDKVARRMDRISRKLDQKIAKMGGRARPANPPPRPPRGRMSDASPPEQCTAEKRKRLLLTGALTLGLAIGIGILVGVATGVEEAGGAAGMLAVAMPGAVLLSEKATRWFGVKYGPRWASRLIHLACGAPLLALGAAPVMDRFGEDGVAVWLGLLAIVVFANWERQLDNASTGEVSFGTALWTAFGAMVATAIAAGMLDGHPDRLMFVSAAVAGVGSLIVQASSWWRLAPLGSGAPLPGTTPQAAVASPSPAVHAGADPAGAPPIPPADARLTPNAHGVQPDSWHGPTGSNFARNAPGEWKTRWLVTRAFWGLVAFASMGGSIFLFVVTLIAMDWHYHDRTAAIIGCIGLAAFMLFAIRKTGPVKRDGFWRETLRPFLISVTMFGMGAAITGMAREWYHRQDSVSCIPDEGKAGLITGLVLCSLLFLVLVLFTGRRRKPRAVQASIGRFERGDDDQLHQHEIQQPAAGL